VDNIQSMRRTKVKPHEKAMALRTEEEGKRKKKTNRPERIFCCLPEGEGSREKNERQIKRGTEERGHSGSDEGKGLADNSGRDVPGSMGR